MKNNWDEVKRRIEVKDLKSSTWASEKKSLMQIIESAEKMEIDPTNALEADLSKLRTIINEAKKAMRRQEKQRLEQLFDFAAHKNMIDLRIALGVIPEEIAVERREDGYLECFIVELRSDQLERIKLSTKQFFNFKMKG